MKYVYIIQSISNENHFYIGCTVDLKRRLNEHNSGKSRATKPYTPWKIKTYIAFDNHEQAGKFETFLKTGNGRAFIKKRL